MWKCHPDFTRCIYGWNCRKSPLLFLNICMAIKQKWPWEWSFQEFPKYIHGETTPMFLLFYWQKIMLGQYMVWHTFYMYIADLHCDVAPITLLSYLWRAQHWLKAQFYEFIWLKILYNSFVTFILSLSTWSCLSQAKWAQLWPHQKIWQILFSFYFHHNKHFRSVLLASASGPPFEPLLNKKSAVGVPSFRKNML